MTRRTIQSLQEEIDGLKSKNTSLIEERLLFSGELEVKKQEVVTCKEHAQLLQETINTLIKTRAINVSGKNSTSKLRLTIRGCLRTLANQINISSYSTIQHRIAFFLIINIFHLPH